MMPLGVVQGQQKIDVINISSNVNDLNLKTLYEASFPPAVNGDEVSVVIDLGVLVGASSNSVPAMRTDVWAAGVKLNLINNATTNATGVMGAGGNGTGPSAAGDGGTGLLVEHNLNIENHGFIAGGGGGGAGTDSRTGQPPNEVPYSAGGGGGAGSTPGIAGPATAPLTGNDATAGTLTAGGNGGDWGPDPSVPPENGAGGGDGGNLGQAGQDAGDVAEPGSEDNTGGAAGLSVDGESFVTYVMTGTLTGPTAP